MPPQTYLLILPEDEHCEYLSLWTVDTCTSVENMLYLSLRDEKCAKSQQYFYCPLEYFEMKEGKAKWSDIFIIIGLSLLTLLNWS